MKIWKQFHKYKKRDLWFARFRLNNKQFKPSAETKDALLDLIAEIRRQERIEIENKKHNLGRQAVYFIPTVETLLNDILPTISKEHQRVVAKRVYKLFLSLLPPQIKVNELKTFHFQQYITHRKAQFGKITKKPVTLQTVYKELYAITSNLKEAVKKYEGLESWICPKLPALPKQHKKKSKRERLVTDKELSAVINELIKKPEGKQTFAHYFHRVRLAHTLEFAFWTGLRRKEISNLRFSQYDENEQALLNVKRFKTDSITEYLPLSKRAVEILEQRRELQTSEFIFTDDGEPIASSYRTLKNICQDLKIPYGKFTDGGFIVHDLRHNFGTEIVRNADIKTAQVLLGHSDIAQTETYLHTSQERLRDAVRKRDKIDYDSELKKIFESVEKKEIDLLKFIDKTKNLFGF